MLEILFMVLMAGIVFRLFVFGVKMAWGLGKFAVTIILLPLTILFTFFKVSIYIAWPLLVVFAIIALLTSHKN